MTTSDIDRLCIDTIRVLACDMVQKANSGHPGAPLGLAPLAHLLYTKVMSINPSNPQWMGRDRFVLSNGHACALQYIMLHLIGLGLSIEDLKAFRQLESKTPGHPESHLTPGIEVSTGPLGQGLANAVGLAIAEAQFVASTDDKVFGNYTWAIAGDGCMMEGVASEACSLAGHLGLGKLIVFYDDNQISIDGSTNLAFTEDVSKRFESYGWHCQYVADGDNDLNSILKAIEVAKSVTTKPSLIKLKTTIGFGSEVAGTAKAHGSPLGAENLEKLKETLGFDSKEFFVIPQEVSDHYKNVQNELMEKTKEWTKSFYEWSGKNAEKSDELIRRFAKKLPDELFQSLPVYTEKDPPMATRKHSQLVLDAIAPKLPEIIGGSADLTSSNLTKWKDSVDFQQAKGGLGNPSGRYLRFGVREHGMFAICNGIAAYGAFVPFASTFLNFISYGMGSVRLTALSGHQVIYIMTHDSIGLGEDGPTHQPVETLAALRALPNCLVFRPADGNEVSGAYFSALKNRAGPSVICLSRQNLPQLTGSFVECVEKGAYVVKEAEGFNLIIIATGSEVHLATEGAALIEKQNDKCKVRVVSMVCWELFDSQSERYRDSILPKGIKTMSVEASCTFGWSKYAGKNLGIDSFGASGPYKQVYEKFGLTAENICKAALEFSTC